MAQLAADGRAWAGGGSTYVGGAHSDYLEPYAALDPSGAVLYVTGTSHSDDFPIQDRFGVTGPVADVYHPVKGNLGDFDEPVVFTMALSGPVCGNGVPDPGEECDDGNTTPGDGCEPDCTRTIILSVHWDYYTATCAPQQAILLAWQTLDEQGTRGFVAQWSRAHAGPYVDASPAIPAKGPSYPYTWLDTTTDASPGTPQPGVRNWYRIRELCLDPPCSLTEPFTTPDLCP